MKQRIVAYQHELKITDEIRVGYDRTLEEKAIDLEHAQKELEIKRARYSELMDESILVA